MDKCWHILVKTPWWGYLLFIYLVTCGIQSLWLRPVSWLRLILVPLILICWSVYTLYQKVLLGAPFSISLWVIFFGLGIYLGQKLTRSGQIQRNRSTGAIMLPGNYSPLLLILLLFVLKFFFTYFYATHLEVPDEIYTLDTLTSACITGFFVGRTYILLRFSS